MFDLPSENISAVIIKKLSLYPKQNVFFIGVWLWVFRPFLPIFGEKWRL
jgi:hypothetical protein